MEGLIGTLAAMIMSRPDATAFTNADKMALSLAGCPLFRMITLEGDHKVPLLFLKSINKAYGPVTVVHFDSHL
ncbi:hypothetical protein N7495_005995 [Penicillium taxi]|uniref:uncharacterized protein n=1 Tax=Penicillium taxi TaxID=168475 RepID=UPI0025454753|nr:uncharacterized protein N7495_005995 [Penicillium taxi]KAJ5894304.1 hypothetical protein N7495_005995 [Penicillium taxi]